MKSCSVPVCPQPAAVVLYAVDGPFDFCPACAQRYEALGYRRQPWSKDKS